MLLGGLREALTEANKMQTEMFYWVKLINCYDGTSDVQYYLKRASISEYNHLAPDETHVSVFASNIVQSTLVNDVNTMAMAEAMGWKTE